MRLSYEECWRRLRSAEHGILCTLGTQDTIDAVPVCYVVVSERIVTPIDRIKPKTTVDLGRLRNLDRNGTATLICDEWNGRDWSQLWWVRAHLARRTSDHDTEGSVEAYERGLREKYAQYRETEFVELIVFDVVSLVGWEAADQADESLPVS
jgi:PPOX class probable F420-dependent enzyme